MGIGEVGQHQVFGVVAEFDEKTKMCVIKMLDQKGAGVAIFLATPALEAFKEQIDQTLERLRKESQSH